MALGRNRRTVRDPNLSDPLISMINFYGRMTVVRFAMRYKLLLFLSLLFTVLPLLLFYSEIRGRVSSVVNMIQDPCDNGWNYNKTLLLTINHDLGRLGNKMFKYATLLGIAERAGRRPFVSPYTADVDMETVFNLTHVDHRIQCNTYWWTTIEETEYAYYDPMFLNLPRQNLKLEGYVQSWKYFHNVENLVRQEFTLTVNMKSEADRVLNEIRQQSPDNEKAVFVGVHVRRRDEKSTALTCESPKSFFVNSFHKMRTLLPGQHLIFVVSGNDLVWCEENLSGENVTILKPESASVHFAVLSSCQHFIVSVGTFGWWAGWLTGGHVIFYEKFPLPESHEANGFHYQDYYPPSWIPVGD